jgi:hypothetical protein
MDDEVRTQKVLTEAGAFRLVEVLALVLEAAAFLTAGAAFFAAGALALVAVAVGAAFFGAAAFLVAAAPATFLAAGFWGRSVAAIRWCGCKQTYLGWC